MRYEVDKMLMEELRIEKRREVKVLDLGCGSNKLEGAIGIDIHPHLGVDVIWDLNSYPLPFPDCEFDLIICNHIIEHLFDVVKIMEEIYRISQPGAKVIIRTPHFSYYESYRDPTHRWHFTWESFDFFCKDIKPNIYTDITFLLCKRRLVFGKEWFNIAKLLSKISMRRYEKYYARRYPAHELYFELETLK